MSTRQTQSVLTSEGTFYAWKAKYSVMTASGAKRLDAVTDENSELKRLLADQMLDIRPSGSSLVARDTVIFSRVAYPWSINRLVITSPAIGSAARRSARSCAFRLHMDIAGLGQDGPDNPGHCASLPRRGLRG